MYVHIPKNGTKSGRFSLNFILLNLYLILRNIKIIIDLPMLYFIPTG
jgi:hypothetical protein